MSAGSVAGRMTADGWVWASLGLLLALLGARAWVVETGHATLGRTPVKVKVLTGACGLAVALVVGLVTVNGGARLVYLVLHPAEAQALEDAANAEDLTTAPACPRPRRSPRSPTVVAPHRHLRLARHSGPPARPGDPGACHPRTGRAGAGGRARRTRARCRTRGRAPDAQLPAGEDSGT